MSLGSFAGYDLIRCIRRNHQNARIHMSTEHNANQKMQRQDKARHISNCVITISFSTFYARGEKCILIKRYLICMYIYMYICMWMYVADQPDIADIDRSTYRSPRFTEESSANQLRGRRPSGSSGIFQRRNCHRLATTRAHKAWYVPGCRPQNMILKRNQG